ncbi:MAG: HAD-IA family hydrolase, partial [Pseudomonadota bacterium]
IKTDPYQFADLWRGEYQPSMERIRSGSRGYVPLDTLHLENLETVLERLGLTSHFTTDEMRSLNRAWEQLPAWPDSTSGIASIRKKAFVAPCSNGSIALMTRIARFTGINWDCILGAEIAQTYKPNPQAYLRSVHALGLEPREVVMVAAHNDDLFAARECGLRTAFLARTTEYGKNQKTDLAPAATWDFIAENIDELSNLA